MMDLLMMFGLGLAVITILRMRGQIREFRWRALKAQERVHSLRGQRDKLLDVVWIEIARRFGQAHENSDSPPWGKDPDWWKRE